LRILALRILIQPAEIKIENSKKGTAGSPPAHLPSGDYLDLTMTTRNERLAQACNPETVWDVLIVGGGATGLGAAVEAASRGYRTLLVERSDFAKGTSSRSTKLVHGGVRYLEQMNVRLVVDALQERGRMLRNAPHLCHDLRFVVPAYNLFTLPYYGVGLKLYDWLSGKLSLGNSEWLSAAAVRAKLPTAEKAQLRGGILYHDGQFDDARYAITLLRTLMDLDGVALNYVEATGILKEGTRATGIEARDKETGAAFTLRARAVINASGVFAEETLRLAEQDHPHLLSVSQGTHMVLPAEYLPGGHALMVPKTADGRVLFAIPWHGRTLVGTTDVAVDGPAVEPRALEEETRFLLDHIERYLGRRPAAEEVLSLWSGLRPLVRQGNQSTSKLSRDHTILVAPSGLITVTGGKWTTYRRMGEDTIGRAVRVAGLAPSNSRTATMPLHGASGFTAEPDSEWERVYGADVAALHELSRQRPELNAPLHERLPFRMREVVWAVRQEMARTTEDVLARRTRALFLDARAALEAAPAVAALLAAELGHDAEWAARDLESFRTLAKNYLYAPD
jgi:glycerol-3-phosphate dehydrogenase